MPDKESPLEYYVAKAKSLGVEEKDLRAAVIIYGGDEPVGLRNKKEYVSCDNAEGAHLRFVVKGELNYACDKTKIEGWGAVESYSLRLVKNNGQGIFVDGFSFLENHPAYYKNMIDKILLEYVAPASAKKQDSSS